MCFLKMISRKKISLEYPCYVVAFNTIFFFHIFLLFLKFVTLKTKAVIAFGSIILTLVDFPPTILVYDLFFFSPVSYTFFLSNKQSVFSLELYFIWFFVLPKTGTKSNLAKSLSTYWTRQGQYGFNFANYDITVVVSL